MSHTPGPWEIQWESCECEPGCGCQNPYPYAIRAHKRRVSPYPKAPEMQEPAEVANLVEVNFALPIDEARSNARLIAAAPDLLEALEAISVNPHLDLGDLVYKVRESEGLGWDGPAVTAWGEAVVKLNAAIRKAKPES